MICCLIFFANKFVILTNRYIIQIDRSREGYIFVDSKRFVEMFFVASSIL